MNTLARVLASFILWATAAFAAGPLNPPAGAVASTGKTLVEVEPRIAIGKANTPGDADSVYRIAQPGSYYLVENLAGAVGRCGIEIAASDVTIDLNGFAMVGVAGSLQGIRTDGVRSRIAIRRGNISGWGGAGIDLVAGGTGGLNSLMEGITVASNGGMGAKGTVATIFRSCQARLNGSDGLVSQGEGVFEGCISRENAGSGFLTGTSGGQVRGCMARQNGGHGFELGLGSQIADSTSQFNGGDGITAVAGSIVARCTARENDGVGIRGAQGCAIVESSAIQNSLQGILVGIGSRVDGCAAYLNTGDGIRLDSDSSATDNVCSANGDGAGSGAGIIATGIDNVILRNNCTDNDRGVECLTFGNFIASNFCSGNGSNWNLAADNHYGPIVNITAFPGPPVVGAGGAPSSLATSDPWANFSH